MELSAAAAPRPQILVAATGDWTRKTLEVEGPAIEKVYGLFNAKDRLRYVRFDFDHNYNQTSREAVYEFFGQWLLRHPQPALLKEQPYHKEADADLLVFPGPKLPADALNETQLVASLIKIAQDQWKAHRPLRTSLDDFKQTWLPAWQQTLQIDKSPVVVAAGEIQDGSGYTISRLHLGRAGKGDRMPALLITPARDDLQFLAVLAHPEGKAAFLDKEGQPAGLARKMIDQHHSVLLLDTFLTGELADAGAAELRKPFANYFTTYNRTDLQERVQDLVTACIFAQRHSKGRRVALVGSGRAGLWAMLAAPAADAVVADCDALDLTSDEALMGRDLFVPGLNRLGRFSGVAALAAPNPLLLHNTAGKFPTEILREAYEAGRASAAYRSSAQRLEADEIVSWITAQRNRLRRAAR